MENRPALPDGWMVTKLSDIIQLEKVDGVGRGEAGGDIHGLSQSARIDGFGRGAGAN
jgi:hypothetical protein